MPNVGKLQEEVLGHALRAAKPAALPPQDMYAVYSSTATPSTSYMASTVAR